MCYYDTVTFTNHEKDAFLPTIATIGVKLIGFFSGKKMFLDAAKPLFKRVRPFGFGKGVRGICKRFDLVDE